MTIFQNEYSQGKKGITTQAQAGVLIVRTFSYKLTANVVAATDIIEIAALPQGAQLAFAEAIQTGITTATTFDVGFMSGNWRDPDPDRTVGDEIFDGEALNTRKRLNYEAAHAIAPVDNPRSIGVKLSANESAGDKFIHLTIGYYL
jgi:hypothetical protein